MWIRVLKEHPETLLLDIESSLALNLIRYRVRYMYGTNERVLFTEGKIFGIWRGCLANIKISKKNDLLEIDYSSNLHPFLKEGKVSLKFRVCNGGRVRSSPAFSVFCILCRINISLQALVDYSNDEK